MYFPTINHISDVLPYIEGWEEFKVNHRGWGTVIDYHYQKDDTFDCPVRRECRGIKFFPNGKIMSRGLNKFFNKGEKPEFEKENAHNFSHYLEKVDGSLIHPVFDETGKVRLATKGGITDVSVQAEQELNFDSEFYDVCGEFLERNITPFFEYVSPKNRIVIRYDRPELIYIGSRNTITGEYSGGFMMDEGWCSEATFSKWCVEVNHYREQDVTLEDVRRWEDKEGVIAVYQGGYREKIKAEDYVLKHNLKDSVTSEKNLLKAVLENQVDDMGTILDEEDFEYVLNYQQRFFERMENNLELINRIGVCCQGNHRKEVAQYVKTHLSKPLMSVFWKIYDGHDEYEVYKSVVEKSLSSQTKIDNIRVLVGNEGVL